MHPTPTYTKALDTIDNTFKSYAKKFPAVFRNPEVKRMVNDLRQPLTPDEAVQLSMKLREDATANYRADKGTTKALGKAQKKAADAVDALIEEHLSKTPGMSGLYQSYRKARQIIAKTYDVEKVLNDHTGNVDAVALARLSKKRPLSDELDDIAKFGAKFEGAARTPTARGSRLGPEVSKAELAGGLLAAASGHPGAAAKLATAAAATGVPAASRSYLLSDLYQNSLRPGVAPTATSEALKRAGAVGGAQTLQDLGQPQQGGSP
jgi:hypothetical protein